MGLGWNVHIFKARVWGSGGWLGWLGGFRDGWVGLGGHLRFEAYG